MESQTNHVLSRLTGATLQAGVVANSQFQRLECYWQRLKQSLPISRDGLFTNSKPSKSKTRNPKQHFGVVCELTETTIFVATPTKKYI